MKRITIVTTIMLACGLALNLAAATKSAPHKASTASKSLVGCLEKGDEPNTFKLTHVAGGGNWELIGAPASLKISDHVGHRVEVTGTSLSAHAAEMAEHHAGEQKESAKEEKKEMKGEAGEHHLKVAALKHVSPTCP
jgi:hypothetical protein